MENLTKKHDNKVKNPQQREQRKLNELRACPDTNPPKTKKPIHQINTCT